MIMQLATAWDGVALAVTDLVTLQEDGVPVPQDEWWSAGPGSDMAKARAAAFTRSENRWYGQWPGCDRRLMKRAPLLEWKTYPR